MFDGGSLCVMGEPVCDGGGEQVFPPEQESLCVMGGGGVGRVLSSWESGEFLSSKSLSRAREFHLECRATLARLPRNLSVSQ